MNRIPITNIITITIAGSLFTVLLFLVTRGVVPQYDANILRFFANQRSLDADRFFRIATWAGSLILLIPAILAISFILIKKNYKDKAIFLAGSFTLTTAACWGIKFLVLQDRPYLYPAVTEALSAYAFPSCHATQFTALALLIYWLIKNKRVSFRISAAIILLLGILVVSVSRLYLQLHYPSDVMGGIMLAILCISICDLFLRH